MRLNVPYSPRSSGSSRSSLTSSPASYVAVGTAPTGQQTFVPTRGSKVNPYGNSALSDDVRYFYDQPDTHQTFGEYIRPVYVGGGGASPSSSSASGPASPPAQTVTFSTCPKCNTLEHHFIQPSRVCANCGHKRYFVSGCRRTHGPLDRQANSLFQGTDLSAMPPVPAGRAYWRPTQYMIGPVYAHVVEGQESKDDPIHQMLAQWAAVQTAYLVCCKQTARRSLAHRGNVAWCRCSSPTGG